MLEDIKKLYPNIKLEPAEHMLGYNVKHNNKVFYIDGSSLEYRSIIRREFVGIDINFGGGMYISKRGRLSFPEKWGLNISRQYGEVEIVPFDELSEKQKEEQREPIVELLEELIIK